MISRIPPTPQPQIQYPSTTTMNKYAGLMKIAAFVVDKQASKIDEMLASGKISNSSWQRYLRSIPLMRNLQASPELTALNRNFGNMDNIIPEQAAISLEGGRSQADKLLSRNPYYKNPAALNYGNMNNIDPYIRPKNLIRSFARESTMLVPNQRTGWLAPLEYRRLFIHPVKLQNTDSG